MTPRQSDAGFGYTHLQSTTVGSGAAELVWDALANLKTNSESVTCRIDAVFDHTVHLSLSASSGDDSSSLLVLGTRDVREGPLMINIDTPLGFSFQRLIDTQEMPITVQPLGQPGSTDGLRFRLGQRGILDVDADTVPTLPAAGGVYERVSLDQFETGGACSTTHIQLIDRLDIDDIEDGLNWFDQLVRYHRGQSASELEALAASVVDWTTEAPSTNAGTGKRTTGSTTGSSRAIIPDVVASLVGRGPGATPAGDDLLAGLVLTLRLVNDDAIARRVRELSCRLTTRTVDESTRMSAALLAQVMCGRAAQPVTNCLETLLTPRADVEAAYRDAMELITIGHTSGADTLVGMLTATTLVLPTLAARR